MIFKTKSDRPDHKMNDDSADSGSGAGLPALHFHCSVTNNIKPKFLLVFLRLQLIGFPKTKTLFISFVLSR